MANRQTRRRNKKKEEVVEITNTSPDILNKIIIGLIVICVLGLFYLLTIYITNKHSDKDTKEETETSDVSINYDEILIGRAFSMSDEDYIVVLYDSSNNEISTTYSGLISTYKAKEDHLPIYTVNMNNSLNKSYSTTDASNTSPTKASELKVNGPTLIRITNGSLVDYVEGEESITNYLS